MSSRKSLNADDLDLSLTGSQLLSPISASRRPGSARSTGSTSKRPTSASGQRDKTAINVVNGISGRQAGVGSTGASSGRQRSNSHSTPRQVSNNQGHQRQLSNSSQQGNNHSTPRQLSSRSESKGSTSQRSTKQTSGAKASARDDFLALFESSTQPKIMRPGANQSHKKGAAGAKPAWMQSSSMNSARSTGSADGDGDQLSQATGGTHGSRYTHSVFQPISARTVSTIDDDDLNVNHLGDHTHLSPREELRLNLDQPGPTHEDINFNFEHVPSTGADQWAMSQEEMSRSRNSLYGDNAYGNDAGSQKTHKLNSIANNMTSQAMSPGTKMALMDMENSYQNIKPKTPVNQVRRPQYSNGGSRRLSDDRSEHLAAIRIQRWFRRHLKRRRAGEAAIRRLLDTKRAEKAEELSQQKDYVRQSQQGSEQRKRIREEKARHARQDAIQELHKKREEKRKEAEKKPETEVKYLQTSGKVTKATAHNKTNNVQKKKASPVQARGREASGSESDNEQVLGAVGGMARSAVGGSARSTGGVSARSAGGVSARSATSGANSKRIDDIFQNNGQSVIDDERPATVGGEEEEEDDRTITALQTERSAAVGAEAGAGSMGASGTKTTLEDLMDTLKKLEEEEKLHPGEHDKNKTPRNWLDDLEKRDSDSDLLTADKLKKLDPSKDNIKKSGFLTDEKLKSIISFLDEVETADRLDEIDQESNRGPEAVSAEVLSNELMLRPIVLGPTAEEIEEMEQATIAASEVTSKMLTQRLELDEKKRSVSMLQKALNQQRELTVRHAKETEKDMRKRLDVQKDEYEETIKRHLSFIDQLIDDKKALSEKCETLVKEMKTVDKKYTDKMRLLHDNHDIELKKIKEVQAAAEKLRREKWIDEKTKKIKEMTVKGLEPEIQRLIAKHKAEVKKIKSIQEAELLESDERAGQRYIAMTEELRDQLAKEKESACARERELARTTYEKQLQQEEEAYQQQRRRLYQEVQEEKERLASATSRQRQELDKMQRQLEDNHSSAASALRTEYEKAREEQERRHTTELRQLKEQLSVEKEAWEENYKKKQETWAISKERDLKDHVRRERDKEIEDVITRLEEDNQMSREECERVAENRIKRIRDKYEGEIIELERTERITTQKYNETKAKLAEYEGENERMKVTLKQKLREIEELKDLLEKRNEERDRVADVVRQEFADRIVATEEENKRLKNEMSEMKARSRLEVERARAEIEVVIKTKEEEMEEVHKRVKQAMVKKEEVVNQLRAQYHSAQKRSEHLEGLLEQQRKQLLKK